MKRILLILTLVASLLSACGGGSSNTTLLSASGGGSSNATQGTVMTLFVPLYIWPDSADPSGAWQRVASSTQQVPITAIINPNSGPTIPVPAVFFAGIAVLQAAGVRVLGYVPTGFGKRTETAIQTDMDTYLTQYGTDGIFLDEVETTNVARFKRLCAHRSAKNIVLNPGTAMPNAYLSGACTQAVVFEDTENNWWGHTLSPENSTLPRTAKVALVHTGANDTRSLQTSLNKARSLGIAAVFVTDRPFSGQTWNTLPLYFRQEAQLLGNMRIP